jgi:dTDP-4-amino-4,6-dideoxygalactose transaminase
VIIEDAAQALGARFKGRCAGTFGVAGCISFYPAKTLGCLGDGGCLITNDDGLYETVKLMRDHGRSETGDVVCWGLNSRLDNLQAAILLHKLESYDEDVARRREIAAIYDAALSGIESLTLPPSINSDPAQFDIYQNYEIEADNRDSLREFLKQRGVGTLLPWGGKAVHQFERLGFPQQLPFTDRLFERVLMLPMNTSLSDDDICYVADGICDFYAANESTQIVAA